MTIRQKQADRRGLTYLKIGQPQMKTKYYTHKNWQGLKHKINRNHPTQRRIEEKRNIESTGKQGLKWQ